GNLQIPKITIDATLPRKTLNHEMYGIFFEEINHAGEGGLYAEMIQNRDMEAGIIPEGWHREGDTVYTPLGWEARNAAQDTEQPIGRGRRTWSAPVWFDSELPAWTFLTEGGAEGSMVLDDTEPLNDRNPHSLKLTVEKMGERCGIVNSGYWGMNIEEGQWYDITFHAHAADNRSVGLVFSLEAPDGTICARATIPEIGRGRRGGRRGANEEAPTSPWRKYEMSMQAYASYPQCKLIITPIEPVTMWFDVISMFPRNTFKNRPNGMRADVAQMLVDMKPGFLRFPGGCVVEGVTIQNRFRWKDSIGDISQRRGDYNLWGYYNTYGLGYHEYLQLAEDLGAESMYVCNVGMSCQARRPSEVCADEDIQLYVQDCLDAIEYAIGSVTSEWGAKRAENGRPEPFKLKYVEIGNENSGQDYQERYRIFYDAIKAKYPDIITIANQRMGNATIEIFDEHYYRDPSGFFSLANRYNNIDRNGPKVYVGEYAVNSGVGTGYLIGGISEAAFMLNMEANADMVIMCSYAPLFENVNQRDWPVNLILMDSSRVVGRSSYQIQKLFGIHRPDVVLQTSIEAAKVTLESVPVSRRGRGGRGGNQTEAVQEAPQYVQANQLYAQAGLDQKASELIIKVVNPTSEPVKSNIILKGLTDLDSTAKVISVGHAEYDAENTLDNPNVV
ncbi:MAG: alpha-L-arabinofuranosidase C-terminal domain-containing protein, partial [Planctomycetota bacterium]